MSSDLPASDSRINRVHSFEELVRTRFGGGINALCWERTLPGDFAEVVRMLAPDATDAITTLDEARLRALRVSAAGRQAVDVLLEDLRLLRERSLDPLLNLINGYPRDEDAAVVVTDVFSFHADSAPVEADTWLCTYHGPASEGLRNEEARRHIDIPDTRARLLAEFGDKGGEDFETYLAENCFDLHYAPAPGARPYSFGVGNLWRIAVEYPGSPVPPCIHRAPATGSGDPPRLLLIS